MQNKQDECIILKKIKIGESSNFNVSTLNIANYTFKKDSCEELLGQIDVLNMRKASEAALSLTDCTLKMEEMWLPNMQRYCKTVINATKELALLITMLRPSHITISNLLSEIAVEWTDIYEEGLAPHRIDISLYSLKQIYYTHIPDERRTDVFSHIRFGTVKMAEFEGFRTFFINENTTRRLVIRNCSIDRFVPNVSRWPESTEMLSVYSTVANATDFASVFCTRKYRVLVISHCNILNLDNCNLASARLVMDCIANSTNVQLCHIDWTLRMSNLYFATRGKPHNMCLCGGVSLFTAGMHDIASITSHPLAHVDFCCMATLVNNHQRTNATSAIKYARYRSKLRILLLCGRKFCDQCPFFIEDFPLDLFKIIVWDALKGLFIERKIINGQFEYCEF